MRPDASSSIAAKAKLGRAAPAQLVGGAAEQRLARAVHEPQAQQRVEAKHGDVDVGDHFLQQRPGLECLEPLIVERARERVHLHHHFAHRVFGIDVSAAHRVVAFAQGLEHVCERPQRLRDALTQGEQPAYGEQADEGGKRPAQPGRSVPAP